MKFQSLAVIFTLIFFAFGCGLADKFKTAANANASPAPPISATPTVSPQVKTDNGKNSLDELGTNYLAFGAGTNVVAFTSESQNSTRCVDILSEPDNRAGRLHDETVKLFRTRSSRCSLYF